jgi:hypothetical protein
MSALPAAMPAPPGPPLEQLSITESAPTTSRAAPRERRGIARLTVEVPASAPPAGARAMPARWRTPEFLFYYVCAVVVIPLMVWVPWRLSSRAYWCRRARLCAHARARSG